MKYLQKLKYKHIRILHDELYNQHYASCFYNQSKEAVNLKKVYRQNKINQIIYLYLSKYHTLDKHYAMIKQKQ